MSSFALLSLGTTNLSDDALNEQLRTEAPTIVTQTSMPSSCATIIHGDIEGRKLAIQLCGNMTMAYVRPMGEICRSDIYDFNSMTIGYTDSPYVPDSLNEEWSCRYKTSTPVQDYYQAAPQMVDYNDLVIIACEIEKNYSDPAVSGLTETQIQTAKSVCAHNIFEKPFKNSSPTARFKLKP